MSSSYIASGAMSTISWEDANLATIMPTSSSGPPLASAVPVTGTKSASQALASTNVVSQVSAGLITLSPNEYRELSLQAQLTGAGMKLRFGLVDANATSFATAVHGVVYEIDSGGIEVFEGDGTTMNSKGSLATPAMGNDPMIHELRLFASLGKVGVTPVIGGVPVALGGHAAGQAYRILVETTGGSSGGNAILGPLVIDRNTQNVEG